MTLFTKKQNPLIRNNTLIAEVLNIVDIRNEIVIRENGYVMLLEILPVNFRLKSHNEQAYILNCYLELLKILNTRFQIVTIARKADLTEHINYMAKYQSLVQEETIKEQIGYYMDFVKECSSQKAVNRRFIIVVPYVPPEGVKLQAISFDTVSSFLYDIKGKIKQGIRKCGNEIKEPENPTIFTAEILYSILNRKTSETQSLPDSIGKLLMMTEVNNNAF